MRSIYFFLLITGCFLLQSDPVIAQPSGYDELIELSPQLTPKQRFFRFFQFQRQDNEFSNSYLHLADACEKISSDLDPLRDYERVVYWLNNAFTYYGVFPVYLDNREARRSPEYFEFFGIAPSEKKLSNEDVLRYVEKRKVIAGTFQDSLKLIYGAFEKSKDHYNNAVTLFNEISRTYENLNEALLRTDSNLLEKLKRLGYEFDASKGAFSEYREMINDYPVGNYDQEYSLQPIETYRLDGLTNSDFLENDFLLWNYSNWINRFRQLYTDDIVPLRKEVVSLQLMFDENRHKLSLLDSVGEDASFADADRLFMYRLGKYDHNSLVRDLFRYYNGRQNLEVMSLSPVNAVIDSVPAMMNRKLRFYYQLAMQKQEADNLLTAFKNNISQEKILLFKDFFEEFYPGENRLTRLADDETIFIDDVLNQGLGNLQMYLSNYKNYLETLGTATGRRVELPLTPYGNNESLNYITQAFCLRDSVPQYVSGIAGLKNGFFVARTSSDKKVEWVKTPEILKTSDSAVKLEASLLSDYENGVVALISLQDTSGVHSSLVHYSAEGKVVLEKKMENPLKPVFLHYDEINKLNLMAFQTPETQNAGSSSELEICLADSAGNIQWTVPLGVKGNLIEIVKPGNQYVALINVEEYRNNEESVDLPDRGLLMATISADGELEGLSHREVEGGMRIDRVFPVSGEEITLIGKQGISGQSKEIPCYLVISPEREVIFDNLR